MLDTARKGGLWTWGGCGRVGLTDSAGTQQRGAENFTCNCEMHLSCWLRQRLVSFNVEFVVINGSFEVGFIVLYVWVGSTSSRWPRARSAPATVKLRLFAKRTKRQKYSQQARGGSCVFVPKPTGKCSRKICVILHDLLAVCFVYSRAIMQSPAQFILYV